MPEYLSKEEIRRWRSSLERITLEEYAARLGKIIQEEKQDESLVDSVILKSLNSMSTEKYVPETEKIGMLTIKSLHKEKEHREKITTTTDTEAKQKNREISAKPVGEQAQKKKEHDYNKSVKVKEVKSMTGKTVKSEPASDDNSGISFCKPLTAREQLVFDHFFENKNTIVYAADLAKILELPRDYVYKYIKNLRSKLNEDILQNAANGGYLLKV